MPAEVMAEIVTEPDGDVQHRGDDPHHQQRSGGAGGEVLPEDVAQSGRLDRGGQRTADAGEDQDLSALLESGGDGALDVLGAEGIPAHDAGADQADQQGDDRFGDERDDRSVDAGDVEDGAGGDQQQRPEQRAEQHDQRVCARTRAVLVATATEPEALPATPVPSMATSSSEPSGPSGSEPRKAARRARDPTSRG